LVRWETLGFYFAGDYFCSLFLSLRDHRASSAGRRETFTHDVNCVQFRNTGPKISGAFSKKC